MASEQGREIGEAADRAVTECINEGILSDFLRSYRAEVLMECLTEFDEKAYRKGIFEEGREEGCASIIRKMFSKESTPEQISELTGLTLEEVEILLQ